MKRPSYKSAIAILNEMDECEWTWDPSVPLPPTVQFLANLYDKKIEDVIVSVVKLQREEDEMNSGNG